MKRVAIGAAAAAVTAVGAAVAGQRMVKGRVGPSLAKGAIGSRLAKTAMEHSTTEDRWHAITINRSPEEMRTVPAPLTELGAAVEVRIRPAPGERGTEIAARLRDQVPSGVGAVAAKLTGEDPVRRLRQALREAKQLAETGEVVLPDNPGTTEPPMTGRPLAYSSRHAREEGRL